jgi:hypothetical protein
MRNFITLFVANDVFFEKIAQKFLANNFVVEKLQLQFFSCNNIIMRKSETFKYRWHQYNVIKSRRRISYGSKEEESSKEEAVIILLKIFLFFFPFLQFPRLFIFTRSCYYSHVF